MAAYPWPVRPDYMSPLSGAPLERTRENIVDSLVAKLYLGVWDLAEFVLLFERWPLNLSLVLTHSVRPG